MGNSSSNKINENALTFVQTEDCYIANYSIKISDLNVNNILEIDKKLRSLGCGFVRNDENIKKIIKVLKYYIETEHQYILNQIDSFEFQYFGNLKIQILNTNAKKNQENGCVNTGKYYSKICEISKI